MKTFAYGRKNSIQKETVTKEVLVPYRPTII